jgi:hypothetical protein
LAMIVTRLQSKLYEKGHSFLLACAQRIHHPAPISYSGGVSHGSLPPLPGQ